MLFLNKPISVDVFSASSPPIGLGRDVVELGVASGWYIQKFE